jgi:hypothetical protein
MHTRSTALLLAALPILVMSRPVTAQETPDSITRAERSCQNAFGRALADFSGKTAECLAECYTTPGGRCSTYFPDAITRDCLSRAKASAKTKVLRRCSGSACPECYDGGEDCDAYASNIFYQTASSIDLATGILYCDDSFSADGLTRAERRCQKKLVAASDRFAKALQRCFAACQKAVQKGSTGPSSCAGAFLDTPTFNPKTQRCIDRARDRLLAGCEDGCADPPDCFPYSCPVATQLLASQVLLAEPETYCEDIPQICGDGRITGDEACDPAAVPTGCAPDQDCFGCFGCYPRCGNGTVDPGEVCDPYAFPNGCPDDLACTRDCGGCVERPAGYCVPTSPDTCSAGFHGCLESCDHDTPGSVCVSSVGGAFVCVRIACTYRTCDTSADCVAGEVCFTEGCCGEPIPGATAGSAIGKLMHAVW